MQLMWIVGISFSCDVMEITLLMFLQGCVRDEWNLSTSTESLLTSVVFAGILSFSAKAVCINISKACMRVTVLVSLECSCTAKCFNGKLK
jgi:hypothetical protein